MVLILGVGVSPGGRETAHFRGGLSPGRELDHGFVKKFLFRVFLRLLRKIPINLVRNY